MTSRPNMTLGGAFAGRGGYTFNYSAYGSMLPYNGSTQGMTSEDGTYIQIAHTTVGKTWVNATYEIDTTGMPRCDWNESGLCENISSFDNITGNGTGPGGHANTLAIWEQCLYGILASITILMTISGNLIVILSFIIERAIRQPTNYFIASLAVSDLLIGLFSMPFYTVYLLAGKHWPLGEFLCDLWLAMDYTVCLTSIYTVFCITIDRFCSVKIPAKYRGWRTDRKVNTMIAMTWIIPILVFFTSIFGWQYFVGERTVEEGMCHVQYMDDALFNCILQVGYFWVTLTVMCFLYTGIYKVALNLQKKSEAKQKKMTTLVSMAGQSMAKIGIGMSKQVTPTESSKKKIEKKPLEVPTKADAKKQLGITSTTSFNSESHHNDKDEDRSSSPAFPSDTEPSSQSHSSSPKSKRKNRKKTSGNKGTKKSGDLLAPSTHAHRHRHNQNSLGNHILNPNSNIKEEESNISNRANHATPQNHHVNHVTPPTSLSLANNGVNKQGFEPVTASDSLATDTKQGVVQGYSNPSLEQQLDHPNDRTPSASVTLECETRPDTLPTTNGNSNHPADYATYQTTGTILAVTAPPELLSGVRYIDQESLKSQQSSTDTIKLLPDPNLRMMHYVMEEPTSPIWKKRDSVIERERRLSPPKDPAKPNTCVEPLLKKPLRNHNSIRSNSSGMESIQEVPHSTAHLHVDTMETESMSVSKITSKREEIQPLTPDDPGSRNSSKKEKHKHHHGKKGHNPMKNIVKVVSKRSKKKSKKDKDKQKSLKSKSENRARKALRTITIILGAFVLCWTPWHVLSMIIGWCPSSQTCVVPLLYDISYWLCYLNSPVNPFCYAFVNQQFKKTFIRILRFDWHRT